jgi:hypothetical protein
MDKDSPAKEPATEAESIGKELPSIDQVEGTDIKSGDESQPRRGRPPKDIETVKRVPFSVSLSPKLVSRIIDQAEEEDVSRSELINEAIGFYLDTHRPGQEYIVLEKEAFRETLREAFKEERTAKPKSDRKKAPSPEDGSNEGTSEYNEKDAEVDQSEEATRGEEEENGERPTPFGL